MDPYNLTIKYDDYVRYLSLCFGKVLDISAQEFKSQYDSQSCRSGVASASSHAGTPLELRGQHGD